jgi:hypothetical protein
LGHFLSTADPMFSSCQWWFGGRVRWDAGLVL